MKRLNELNTHVIYDPDDPVEDEKLRWLAYRNAHPFEEVERPDSMPFREPLPTMAKVYHLGQRAVSVATESESSDHQLPAAASR